jgi:hypothetical protein
MACTNCPPAADTGWKQCRNPACAAAYKDYEGLYHSTHCPKCADARKAAEAFAVARTDRFAGMRTNAPGDV